jgi:hypothetical protein
MDKRKLLLRNFFALGFSASTAATQSNNYSLNFTNALLFGLAVFMPNKNFSPLAFFGLYNFR